jgi:hypothetical protein
MMKKSAPKTSERKSSPAGKRAAQPQQQTAKKDGEQQRAASGEGKQYGEGNYAATRQYNAGLKEHVQNHDIEREARDAAPRSPAEEQEMNEAERVGRSRAKGKGRAGRDN